ncbi:hypothetical protein FHX74_001569 [Friedmanniella endophytica]|uniref:Uncharacterized protein n=1 Tax=Microlunatus kandeliicorticis TaxID=1759536 RepID=A0A7W3P5G5_9ACTN|nr:hypothetical protein [Microlunatus kandeliicorticis]
MLERWASSVHRWASAVRNSRSSSATGCDARWTTTADGSPTSHFVATACR